MVEVYGIKNCSTVRKALVWLDENKVEYNFHDFKKEGLAESKVNEWIEKKDWQTVINRKGHTWRKLDEKTRESINDKSIASKIAVANPSIVKRPVIEFKKILLFGFDEDIFDNTFIK